MEYYTSYSEYLKERFGCKVYKVPVSIGASCPNREHGLSGCTYCDPRGSASPLIDDSLPLVEQIARGMAWATQRYKARKFIIYFQPFSNTYLPLNVLRQALVTAQHSESVAGISIGTRPDCVPEEVIDLVAEFSPPLDVWLEIGLQSAHSRTLKRIKRGHSLAEFIDAVLRIKKRERVFVATHLIIGLPGEGRDDIIETARILASLPLDGIKIHLLHILKDSEMAKEYANGKVETLSLPEYASLVVDVIEHLPRGMLIQRITAEAEKERLIAPLWCLDKHNVIRAIHDEFKERKTMQGRKCAFGFSTGEIERRTLEGIASELARD